MEKRPDGFVKADRVLKVIKNSIDSVSAWGKLTNDAWGDTEERIEHLNELMDIIIELKWRYGSNHVLFKFSKKNVPNTIAVSYLITTFWENRIRIYEDINMSLVYINF